MRKAFIITFILLNTAYTQVTSSLQAWENILQTPELVDYFRGIFNHLGVTVEETGEEFTIHHTGERFNFESGIKHDEVDFIVPIKVQNIQNMIAHSQDGKISLEESWRILDVLFTPLTRVTLQTPLLSINWRRKLAGVEDLTASIPMILSCGVLNRTPSISYRFRIYLFLAVHTPLSAIASRPISIFCS